MGGLPFCQQLHQHKKVSDDIWQQAIDLWGEKGVVDLIGIDGYIYFKWFNKQPK
ncbi:hypothetical protein E05_51870 (plasmid) [Plautia stali symbiont]|nr:hypothetical protein E05_51870 [Plautia stali symbiont]